MTKPVTNEDRARAIATKFADNVHEALMGEMVIEEEEHGWLVSAISAALQEAREDERKANLEILYGLLPLDTDPILDGIRGALLHAIGLIDMRRPADAVAFLRSRTQKETPDV